MKKKIECNFLNVFLSVIVFYLLELRYFPQMERYLNGKVPNLNKGDCLLLASYKLILKFTAKKFF